MESIPPTTQPKAPAPAGEKAACTPDVQGIPAVLVWALGGMAVLMCLVAVGLGLGCYWDALPPAVQMTSLLLVPCLLWGGYYLAARHGHRSVEVAAVFICLSWLVLLILVQCCIHALPLWQMGLVYVAGLLVLPLLHPWRTTILALALGCVVELVLLWWSAAYTPGGLSFSGLRMCLLSCFMLWAVGGCWCILTRRYGYARFGLVAPICYGLFLCAFYAQILLPTHLMPVGSAASLTEVGVLCALWALAVLVALPLHVRFARRQQRAVFTYSLLAFAGISLVSVPLVVLLRQPIVSSLLAFLYAAAGVYYGAEYKFPWLVLTGCVAFFLSAFCIPLLLGVNPLGSAIILLVLGGLFLYAAFLLNARRKRLISSIVLAERKQSL
ncbi:MAG: hypothetical protein Q4F38_04140 [Akkermansia sp.]|nr:hypothetical protein [Akkermansia sp.]